MSKPDPSTILAATAHAEARSELRAATMKDHARELASRESDGIEVVLLWHPREDAVTLAARCGAAVMTGRGPYAGQLGAEALTP